MSGEQFVNLWARIVDIVNQVAWEFDERWRKRKRKLDSKFLILFILRLVLSKNKQGYGSILEEIWENNSDEQFPTMIAKPVCASSVCEARQKLDESIFQELNDRVIITWEQEVDESNMWHGHRLFAVDGSKINLPRQLLDYGCQLPSSNAYYPQGLVSCLYQLKSQIPTDFMLVNHGNERICAQSHLQTRAKDDIVVYDRGYLSYLLLYIHIEHQIHCIFRLQQGQTFTAIKQFWDSKDKDSVVMINPSKTTIREIKKQYPEIKVKPLKFRLIKYTIEGTTYCLGTTLISEKYPQHIFPDVYHARWGIEELYKISKIHIDVEDFHSKSERGVKQELYAHFFIITAARIFENKAYYNIYKDKTCKDASKYKKKNLPQKEESIKINFKNCLLVIGRSLEKIFFQVPYEIIQKTIDRIVDSISRLNQKIRPGRHYPRQSRKPIKKWQGRKKVADKT